MSSQNHHNNIDPLAGNPYSMTITPTKSFQSNQQKLQQQRRPNNIVVSLPHIRGIVNNSSSLSTNSISNSSNNSSRKVSYVNKESTKVGIDIRSHPLVQQHIQKYLHPQSPSQFKNSSAATATSTSYNNNMNTAINHPLNHKPTTSSGGSARVQQNHVNSNAVIKNGIHLQKGRNTTTATVADVKFSRVQIEDSEERSATPDSTTEPPPPPRPTKPPFKEGDDVLFTTDDGSYIFGTVGMIHEPTATLQILFGDGTQQWASFKRVKKMGCSANGEDETDNNTNSKEKPVNKQSKSGSSSTSSSSGSGVADQSGSSNNAALNSEQVTCGSCGVVKKVAGRKALTYAPHTTHQFNCRRCLNKSGFTKNNMPSLVPQSPGRGRGNQASSSSSKSHVDHQRGSGESSSRMELCFHCEGKTTYNDRLHCNLCERACHLSCLAITPTPLEGDRFWDVICSACGTQNGESGSAGRSKVFSCRRSISSWSDVAHLVLSCLGSQNSGEKFYDLDLHLIPFIDKHLDCLHLPRVYKNSLPDNRKMFLSTALNNAKLRFINGKDVNKKTTYWAIRDNNNHQGYPLRLPNNNSNSSSSSSNISKGANNKAPPLPSINNSANGKYPALLPPPPPSSPFRQHHPPFVTSGDSSLVEPPLPFKISPLSVNSKGGRSSEVKEMVPRSPIRSCNVSSTQQESGFGCLTEGSSRTLGKSGKEGVNVLGKRSPTLRGGNTSPGKSLTNLTAQSQSGRLIMKAKRTISTKNIPAAAGKSENDEDTMMDVNECSVENNDNIPVVGSESDQDMSTNGDSEAVEVHFAKTPISLFARPGNRNKRKLSPEETLKSNGSIFTANISKLPLTNKRPKVHDLQDNRCEKMASGNQSKVGDTVREDLVISPIAEKMSNIYKTMNSTGGSSVNKGTPEKDSTAISPKMPTLILEASKPISLGKAVKSASVKPGYILEKPLLRVRKPKVSLEVGSKKDLVDCGGTSKKTGVIGKKLLNAGPILKGRGRGRPLKGANTVQNLTNSTTIPIGENLNSDVPGDSQFSVQQSTVEELLLYGEGTEILCLPKAPKTKEELFERAAKYLKEEEKSGPPSVWKSNINGAATMPWQKSKKDFTDPDSYEITGRMVDATGQVWYHYDWKDGYGGHSSDEDSTGPYYEFDDPDALNETFDMADGNNVGESPVTSTPYNNMDEINSNSNGSDDIEILEPKNNEGQKVIKSEINYEKSSNSFVGQDKGKDSFLGSGLGLRRNSVTKPNYTCEDNVIDLTTDSP